MIPFEFSETEQTIITKNVKAVIRYIENEIRPKLKEDCRIEFGGGDGWGQHHSLTIEPWMGCGEIYGTHLEFNDKALIKFGNADGGYESAYAPGVGMNYSFELLRNWQNVKRKILREVARQNGETINPKRDPMAWLETFTV